MTFNKPTVDSFVMMAKSYCVSVLTVRFISDVLPHRGMPMLSIPSLYLKFPPGTASDMNLT